MEKIKLQPSSINLNEVTVTAKTPYIERKIDRTVINVNALSSNAGTDILEVLERAPGLSVDNNGSLLLKGRSGVTVFINDKPSYLSGTELETYLRSLPAGTVKQIEIMTNPPAKYEAAGNSGVINIILKKNKLQGFNGSLSASYHQGIYNASNNSLNLNYNKNKFGLTANVSGGFWTSFQDLNINRYYRNEQNEPTSSFAQNSKGYREGKYVNSNIGLDYFLSDNTTLGISYRLNQSPSDHNVDNTAIVEDPEENLLQTVIADNNTKRTFQSNVYTFFVNHKLDSLGSSLTFDADYAGYNSGSDQDFNNFIYDPNDNLTFQDVINGEIPSTIDIYAAKTDFTKMLKQGSRFEAGLRSAFTQTDNEAIYSTTVGGITEPDYDLSNRFLYDEWINAGYVNYSRSLGKVDLQAGLRVESTRLTGNQLGNVEKPDTSFTRNYTSVFPTFYASWKMDSAAHNTLTFSYGRRIDRPYFQDLNPFVSPLDKFTFYVGNPNLLPTYSHNLSLAHSFKNLFTTTLNYSKTVDGINETLEIRNGIYYSRPGNIASSQTLSLSLEGSIPVTKWYNLNTYLEVSHLSFESQLYTEQLNSSGTYCHLSLTNSFRFKKGWSADITGMYRSDLVYAQLLLKEFSMVNLGIRKTILNGAGNLRLSVSDLFFTRVGDGIINNLRLTDADWNSTFDSRRVGLTFSWRFGQSTRKQPRYDGNGSSEEQDRVRN
ncbi:MAG: outer membrane beta-barrel protein [Saprospiraceae bacterium]